jgi:hypothetical protein
MNPRRDPPVNYPVPGALTNGTLWKFGYIFDAGAIFKVVLTRDLDARKEEDVPLIARGIAWFYDLVVYNAKVCERMAQAPRDGGDDDLSYMSTLSTTALAAHNRCAPSKPPNPADRFWPPRPPAA